MLLPLLSQGLTALFGAIGLESLSTYAHEVHEIPIGVALSIVVLVLLASVAASLIWPPKGKH